MKLDSNLQNKGFSLSAIEPSDFDAWYKISRACYEKYVDEYFGGWVEEAAVKLNQDALNKKMEASCSYKLLLNGSVVGFLAFDVQEAGSAA